MRLISWILGTLIVAVIFLASQLQEAQVTTTAPIDVKDGIAVDARTIAILPKGRRFDVYACEDVKQYFLYKIRLNDGRYGYVGVGPIDTAIEPAWKKFWGPPLVWNCY